MKISLNWLKQYVELPKELSPEELALKLTMSTVEVEQVINQSEQYQNMVVGEIVDGQKKAALLRQLAQRENISLEQTIAVGDGANDLPMISIAGLGVAFNAKPLVRQKAKQSISSVGLDGLLYLMGISEREIGQSRA